MKLLVVLLSLFGMAVGLGVYFKPGLTIEIQRKFYEKINWRMEPISMPKEVRNTRIMGTFLFIFSLAALIFLFRI